ncbi:MAG: carbon-nitrogen hydrolase family protein [Actinomycetota bacterium]
MRASVCQMRSGEDVEANVATAEQLLHQAADDGADLAALPEVFTYLGRSSGRAAAAEPVPGPTTERLSAVARDREIWVLGGSVLEAHDGLIFNTSVLFDRAGELAAIYRKIHLYDVELPDQAPIRESDTFTPGEQLVTHPTEQARLGLSICYDLRFPELYRGLMVLGAEVLLVPSQFQHTTGAAHWEVLLRARAIENQCFVVAPAQWGAFGREGSNRRSHGHSMIVDPWGRVVVEAPEEGDGVVTADLDLTELREIRTRLPALQHRRLGLTC